jgi:hypothetical protein
MNGILLWVTMAVLGAAATLLTSFGLLPTVVFLALTVPLILRGDHLVALSGLLTGFGGSWLFWMGRQLATGGTLDNAPFWTAVGIVPLLAGCVGLALVAVRALRRPSPPAPPELGPARSEGARVRWT